MVYVVCMCVVWCVYVLCMCLMLMVCGECMCGVYVHMCAWGDVCYSVWYMPVVYSCERGHGHTCAHA